MMESLAAYLPLDKCQAIARVENLLDRVHGAVLFDDIFWLYPADRGVGDRARPETWRS